MAMKHNDTLKQLEEHVNLTVCKDEEKEKEVLQSFLDIFPSTNLSEHARILRFVLKLIENNSAQTNTDFQCKIIDKLCDLVKGHGLEGKYAKWKDLITNNLDYVGIFDVLENIISAKDGQNIKKFSKAIQMLTAILNYNVFLRTKFDEVFTSIKLKKIMESYSNLDEHCAMAFVDLMTSMNIGVRREHRLITIQRLSALVIDVLPSFTPSAQLELCEILRILHVTVPQNSLQSCQNGLVEHILNLLATKILCLQLQECLVSLVEIIGYRSITPKQLKMLIGLFQKNLDKLADRLVHCLERMSSQRSPNNPSYFIDFYNFLTNTYITCPKIERTSGKGVSIHTWICLDFSLPLNVECKSKRYRSMLYSFENNNGGGFEGYFTYDGFLVVACTDRRRYHKTTCTSTPFTDKEWHGVTIVHTHRLLGKASVCVYVDGIEYSNHPLPFPSINNIRKGLIGGSAINEYENEQATILNGQMSSFTLFRESLTPEKITEICTKGPNAVVYFADKGSQTNNDGERLCLTNVVFSFNAKAAVGTKIHDLKNDQEIEQAPNNLKARICRVTKIQETIQCIGGLSVLFPLLEQASLRKRSSLSQSSSQVSFNMSRTSICSEATISEHNSTQDMQQTLSERSPIFQNDTPQSSVEKLDTVVDEEEHNKKFTLHNAEQQNCLNNSLNFHTPNKDSKIDNVNNSTLISEEEIMPNKTQITNKNIVNESLMNSQTNILQTKSIKLIEKNEMAPQNSSNISESVTTKPNNISESVTIKSSDLSEFATSKPNDHLESVSVNSNDISENVSVKSSDISESVTDLSESVTTNSSNNDRPETVKPVSPVVLQRSSRIATQKRQRCSSSFTHIAVPTNNVSTEEFTLLDPIIPRTPCDSLENWLKTADTRLMSGAHFVSLVQHIIAKDNMHLLDIQGVRVIGYLLQRCDPQLINIGFINSLSKLVEVLLDESDPTLLESVHQFILFDFNIWQRAEASVQMAHIQQMPTYVNKKNHEYFSREFGIGFLLRVVELYYGAVGAKQDSLPPTLAIRNTDLRILRKALLSSVKRYLIDAPTKENMQMILSYLACAKSECVDEVMDELLSIINLMKTQNTSQTIATLLIEDGCSLLYWFLVSDITNATRKKILEILLAVFLSERLPDKLKKRIVLEDPALFPAVAELISKQCVSKDIVMKLLRLGRSSRLNADHMRDVYTNFDVVLSVLRVCRTLDVASRLNVAIEVNMSIKLCQQSAAECAKLAHWHRDVWMLVVNDQGETHKDLASVVIEIVHRVMWTGIIGSDRQSWTTRSEAIACLHELAARHTFDVFSIERALYEGLLNDAHMAIREAKHAYASNIYNANQVLNLAQNFLLSTEISGDVSQKWSSSLLTNMFDLLDVMGVWEESNEASECTELLLATETILYAAFRSAATRNERDADVLEFVAFLETATACLGKLLNKRKNISHATLCCEIYSLCVDVLPVLRQYHVSDILLCSLLRYRMDSHREVIFSDGIIPSGMPSPTIGNFFEYTTNSQEFAVFLEKIKTTAVGLRNKAKNFVSNSVGKMWMEALNAVSRATQKQDSMLQQSVVEFSKTVSSQYEEMKLQELKRVDDLEKGYRQKNSITKHLWEYQKRFYKSERGAWCSSNSSMQHFKLSNMENRYRMRLKLSENLKYTPHLEAARKPNVSAAPDLSAKELSVNIPASNVEEEEEDEEEDPLPQDDNLTGVDLTDATECGATVYTTECKLITLMDECPGRIELTHTHFCFYDNAKADDFKFNLDELREIYNRRYTLRKTAVEFFLLDRTSYFVNFSSTEEKDVFYQRLVSMRPANLFFSGIKQPTKLFEASRLTNKWVEREISNFEYLMQINTISGRTYNDLAQYPIFPWVLRDYTSESIDLSDPQVYRDLSKPLGALNEERADKIRKRFADFEAVDGFTKKSHYFTHYSNSAGVIHYMLRVEPFTSLHIELQSGKFDCANRLFYSLPSTWNSIERHDEIRELTPEFFCFPEFLLNLNNFDFGCLQNGERISDVELPAWASSAYHFVHVNRQALESEYVSDHLHEWIDLIFGYKQRGVEAEQALNVFCHYTYEGGVDWDKIDARDRHAYEAQINNFGQIPTQLLKSPHPRRKKTHEIDNAKPKPIADYKNVQFSRLKIGQDSPVVWIGTSKREKKIIPHAVQDTLVVVHRNAAYGVHSWLPQTPAPLTSSTTPQNFTPLSFSPDVKKFRQLPGCISPLTELSARLFGFTADGHAMISCGYWDNSIRMVGNNENLKSTVYHHNDVVTCLSIDADGSHLITGSADQTVAVWRIEQTNGASSGLSRRPIQTLYGHDAPLADVAMISDLDIAVSGATDGVTLVHTFRKGVYMHTLRPTNHPGVCVVRVQISDTGRIAVLYKEYSETSDATSLVCVYSVNGAMLGEICMSKKVVTDILITQTYLALATNTGTLQLVHLDRPKEHVYSQNVKSPIHTVSATHNGSHIFVGIKDGDILVMCPNKTHI